MIVKISGRPVNISKKETRDVLNWMARELRVDRYKTPLSIDVKFRKNLKRTHGYRGSAVWEDDNHRPREFTLEVDAGLSKKLATITLLHEMVHIKQYATGQLKDLLRHFSLKRWGHRLIDENKITYKKLPWEKEAYKLEVDYYEKWKNYNKKKV